MKKTSFALAALALALSGCATTGGQSAPLMSDAGMTKLKSSGVGAGVGCVVGAVGARLMGGNAAAGCAIGAAGGAAVGYAKARQDEIDQMKMAQAEMPGAQLETRQVQVTEKASGEQKQVDAFSQLSVPLSPRALSNPEGVKVFGKLGTLAAKQGSIVTITGSGTPAQREQAAALIRQGGAQSVQIDPRVRAGAGKPGDMVIILSPADKSNSVQV